MDYTLIRTRRKTIAIQITAEAELIVRAPLKAPKTVIDAFVREKKGWIDEHLSARRQLYERKRGFALSYGDDAVLCGERYPILPASGGQAGFDGQSFFIPADLAAVEIRAELMAVYRALAQSVIKEKVAFYASVMSLCPSAVKINAAKTRWGSCSGKNSLNFSWRLVLADDDIIDYVVVHELAHIKEHNHSDRFWRVVESILPDYRRRRLGLKALQERLSAEDWD